jgi:hypothetical protein
VYLDALHIDLLINSLLGPVRANMEAAEEDKLPEYEVLGQVVSHPRITLILLTFPRPFLIDVVRIFGCLQQTPCDLHILSRTLIFAAMDPTSNAMTRILHLMALHPKVQEKLRQEIMDALELNGGRDFTWDELDSLTYLDAVCRETLRMSVRLLCSVFSSDVYCPSTVSHLSRNCFARTRCLPVLYTTESDSRS